MLCRICNKEYKNLGRHVSVHYKKIEVKSKKMLYFHDVYKEKYDIVYEYLESKKSASQIAKEITQLFNPFPVQKGDVLNFLKYMKIKKRTTSESGKEYYKKNSVWNKGLTKHDHASIKKYSDSRTGKNNPIYSLTAKEREEKIYYWKFKSESDLHEIRNKISKTLKKGYKSGRIKHISKTNPIKYKKIHEKMLSGYFNALNNGSIKRQSYTSSYEKRIANILEEENIKFVQQKSCNKKYRYDFFLESLNLYIEFNGDYWHANPRLFKENYYHPHKNILAREIWEYDNAKRVNVINSGYNFITIWESEVKKLDDHQLKDYIIGIIKNQKH
jgi:very-short-patch-repair endonuclease